MANDAELDHIRDRIRQYAQEYLSAAELVNSVFCDLGQTERFDLVDEVIALIPESAQTELWSVVETALQPGSSYLPFVIGNWPRHPYWVEWRQRMRPACRQLAALFQQSRDRAQAGPGHP